MRALRDYQCKECGYIEEHLIDHTVEEVDCECGGKAIKTICCPQYIKIGKFRSTIDSEDWAKTRIKRNRKIAENEGL